MTTDALLASLPMDNARMQYKYYKALEKKMKKWYIYLRLRAYLKELGRKRFMCNNQSNTVRCWDQTITELHQLGLEHTNIPIRISFAYLFRIRIGEKFMLVQSERTPNVYKPIGGAYRYFPGEIKYLVEHYNVQNDYGDVPDLLQPGDYRLLVPSIHLPSFLQRFDVTKKRESISDLSREFVEELINTNILSFSTIKYRYCGRHISKICFSTLYQRYDLFLADIVELLPDHEQHSMLMQCYNLFSPRFLFVTSNEIKNLRLMSNDLHEDIVIAEHSYKFLPENEHFLFSRASGSDVYEVTLKI